MLPRLHCATEMFLRCPAESDSDSGLESDFGLDFAEIQKKILNYGERKSYMMIIPYFRTLMKNNENWSSDHKNVYTNQTTPYKNKTIFRISVKPNLSCVPKVFLVPKKLLKSMTF